MSEADTAQPKTATDSGPAFRYTASLADRIEQRWQARWDQDRTFVQPNPGEEGFDPSKPKFFCMDMFPYPSGAGLHVGHPEGYTATDIVCRYKKMQGFNVLHPMGFDAFGLPAEQYAIQTGVHPAVTTRKAIDNFRRQLKRFGFCYDWEREFATIDEDYYVWTQWVFLKLYGSWFDPAAGGGRGRGRPIEELIRELKSGERKAVLNPDAAEHSADEKSRDYGLWDEISEDDRHTLVNSYRLAYLGEQTVNWCPKLGTALANEEVIDGKSERGGFPVFRKPLRQWMLRITAYAGRLLEDLAELDWPESTRTQQSEWIGRSEGAEIDFELRYEGSGPGGLEGGPERLRVYTTRPDTVFGATYMVVAPEHPLVEALVAEGGRDELAEYAAWARNRSDVERQENKEKTGVFTGARAVNPATGETVPVWCADYVLMGYGTGAIMAVPSGDERDFDFATKFGLPIKDVCYARPLMVVKLAADAATESERDGSAWMGFCADLLGLMTSEEPTRPGAIHEAIDWSLHQVRTRRDGNRAEDNSETEGRKRGSVRAVWTETLSSIGAETWQQARDLFARADYHVSHGEAFTAAGFAVNSTNEQVSLDGLPMVEAKARIIAWLEASGHGRRKINFKLRDWLFSRQRYWGEPFPIVFDSAGRHYAVDEAALPVSLPELADYEPAVSEEPQPLLAKVTDWVETDAGGVSDPLGTLAAGASVQRETNTMPGWAGSCWYHLRYCDPKNAERFASRTSERYWTTTPKSGVSAQDLEDLGTFDPAQCEPGGVDLYMGGSEHAVLHLLYARFWHKALFDLGEVSTPEPFQKLFHQGLITSHAFQRGDRSLVPVDQVEERDGAFIEIETGEKVEQIIAKMSKSLKNVVNPDDVIAEFGADTFRLYEMYMGPLADSKPWDTRAIGGMFKFLSRAWRVAINEETGTLRIAEQADADIEKALHRTVAKVGDDIDRLAFNTAIAAMIEFVNAVTAKGAGAEAGSLTADQLGRFVRVLGPFAPHMAEELWAKLGETSGEGGLCSDAAWPGYDEAMLVDDEVEVAVQLKGKVKARIKVPAGLDAKGLEAHALGLDEVKAMIDGLTVRKVIAVPDRLVNIVAT